MGVYEEYRQRVNQRLNVAERIHGLVSSTDDRIDELAWLTAQVVEAIQGIVIPGPGPGPGPGPAPTPGGLTTRLVQLIKAVAVRATDIVYPAEMADCRAAHRVLLHVSNGLDQEIRVTVIGNTGSSYSGAEIITEMTCPAGEKTAYGLKLEEWMPYVGVWCQALVAPTAGNLDAVAIVQE